MRRLATLAFYFWAEMRLKRGLESHLAPMAPVTLGSRVALSDHSCRPPPVPIVL